MSWLDSITSSIGNAFNGVIDGATKILDSNGVDSAIQAGAQYAANSLGSDSATQTKTTQSTSLPAWALPVGILSIVLLVAFLLIGRRK